MANYRLGQDAINVSALNQYGYCPRRCGLTRRLSTVKSAG